MLLLLLLLLLLLVLLGSRNNMAVDQFQNLARAILDHRQHFGCCRVITAGLHPTKHLRVLYLGAGIWRAVCCCRTSRLLVAGVLFVFGRTSWSRSWFDIRITAMKLGNKLYYCTCTWSEKRHFIFVVFACRILQITNINLLYDNLSTPYHFVLSLKACEVLACVCCADTACRIQYDGMALRCLFPSLPNNVVSLDRS